MAEEVVDTKVCGIERASFLKAINFICGVGMVVFGIFNMFSFVTAGSQVVLVFGFAFY